MSKKTQNVVAIILARGGSKGLINKNILPLDGKPLIAYTIEAAKQFEFDPLVVDGVATKVENKNYRFVFTAQMLEEAKNKKINK